MGSTVVQITLKDIVMVIDVELLLLSDEFPSLISLRDLVENGLNISIQDFVIKHDGMEQPLTIETYFLVYSWTPEDVPYFFYTEMELRTIHRTFVHT